MTFESKIFDGLLMSSLVVIVRLFQRRSPPSERSSLDRDGTFLADPNSDSQARTMQSNHQLFVGNLPHDLTNDELRDFFESW